MAKKPNNAPATDTASAATDTAATLADLILKHGDVAVRYADLPEKSKVRMAQKAWNELLNDSTAFSKEQLDKIRKEASEAGQDADAAVVAAKARKRDERVNSILSGEFSVGARGPRGTKLDTVIRAVAVERIRVIWANSPKAKDAAGKPLPFPKGDKLQTFIDKYLEKHGDDVRAEATRRMESTASAGDDLLD